MDFAEAVGAAMPPMPETQQHMLQEFALRVAQATQPQGAGELKKASLTRAPRASDAAAAAAVRAQEARKWCSERWRGAASTAVGLKATALEGARARSLSR